MASFPLGITASHKQSAILMHMQYRVTLPDHDWVVAEKYKLIPSVYAGITIKPNGYGDPAYVTYSGPTVIRMRSGKHDTSNAESHAADFDYRLRSNAFASMCKTSSGSIKPVVIVCSDGGLDENPRYEKMIKYAVKHFKENDLDALFVVTNAPGRSAFNRVEHRMAPLSLQLSGVVLKHDAFGNHLDSQGKCTDEDMEIRNFQYAGETLAEL